EEEEEEEENEEEEEYTKVEDDSPDSTSQLLCGSPDTSITNKDKYLEEKEISKHTHKYGYEQERFPVIKVSPQTLKKSNDVAEHCIKTCEVQGIDHASRKRLTQFLSSCKVQQVCFDNDNNNTNANANDNNNNDNGNSEEIKDPIRYLYDHEIDAIVEQIITKCLIAKCLQKQGFH
ncbi:hypothetical protein RFI_16050, partial [Reticulomyxa filosa]